MSSMLIGSTMKEIDAYRKSRLTDSPKFGGISEIALNLLYLST